MKGSLSQRAYIHRVFEIRSVETPTLKCHLEQDLEQVARKQFSLGLRGSQTTLRIQWNMDPLLRTLTSLVACNGGSSSFNPWVRKIPCKKEWQPIPVFLSGESHGQRSLAGYSPWGHKESDMTEWLTLSLSQTIYRIKQNYWKIIAKSQPIEVNSKWIPSANDLWNSKTNNWIFIQTMVSMTG